MASGFTINSLRLKNFRNYVDELREFEPGINKIVGPNATGKTNLIEAVGLLTQISSFRNALTAELINKNAKDESSQIEVEIFDNTTQSKHNLKLLISDGKKTYKLNDKTKSISSLKGNFPSVVFTPDDLAFVKGSNTMRRSAVDGLGSQISKDYYTVLHDYAKALKQKNALLRDGASDDMFKSVNDVLIKAGAQLVFYRHGLIQKILPVISDYYSQIAGENEKLSIEYYPSWAMDDKLEQISRDEAREKLSCAFDDKLDEEKVRCRALIGPHRDRIVFVLNGEDAQNFASQGQQRSIVLSFKLTEVKLIEDMLDKRPILLLDDVMSELDESRREKLQSFIEDKTQVFITSTD